MSLVNDVFETKRATRGLMSVQTAAMRQWMIERIGPAHRYSGIPTRLRVDAFLDIRPIMPTDWPIYRIARLTAGGGFDTVCMQLCREWRRANA